MLMEENMLIYPDTEIKQSTTEPDTPRYLKKSNPLIMLASYLRGGANKEMLVDILTNIQNGRHFYFTYEVAQDGPLGKYVLLSEVHSEGQTWYSKTAKDDFFFIEKVSLTHTEVNAHGGTTCVVNHSPEPVSIRVCEYSYSESPAATKNLIHEIPGHGEKVIRFSSPATCILYNEERITLPVVNDGDKLVVRNQNLLQLPVKVFGENVTYAWNKQTDETFELEGAAKAVWEKANGLHTRQVIRTGEAVEIYDELLQKGMIKEL